MFSTERRYFIYWDSNLIVDMSKSCALFLNSLYYALPGYRILYHVSNLLWTTLDLGSSVTHRTVKSLVKYLEVTRLRNFQRDEIKSLLCENLGRSFIHFPECQLFCTETIFEFVILVWLPNI